MKKIVSLELPSDKHKGEFFRHLRDAGKVPVCKNCGKLFQFGFPDSEDGVSDYLICQENLLLCECEYNKIVKNLYNQKEDGLVDIFNYYEKKI